MLIQHAGRSFKKLDDGLEGSYLQDKFEIVRPRFLQMNYASFAEHKGQILMLRHKRFPEILFRYQITYTNIEPNLLLIGSLWVTDLDVLNQYDIHLSDFALHDAITDMLQVIRSKEIVMDEIRLLANKLETQKHDLTEVRNELSLIIQNIPSALLVEDNQRKISYTNQQFCDLFEIPATPVQLKGFDCAVAGQQASLLFENETEFVHRIDELLHMSLPVYGELLRMKNGKIVERDYLPIFLNGLRVGQLWQYKDVTISRSAEYAVRQSEEKYRSLIESLRLGLLEVDLNGIITRVYPSFCDLSGYSEEDLLGQDSALLLFEVADLDRMKTESAKRLQGLTSTYEVRLKKKDGKTLWTLIAGSPIYDSAGTVVGSIGLHWDISERKEREEELQQAKDLAEKSSRAKKEFMAKMSHELRTPLNVIHGMAQLLRSGSLSSDQEEQVSAILKSSENLTALVSDLLDISRIESGKILVQNHWFSIKELVLDLANQYYQVCKNKGILFVLKLHPGLPARVQSDSLKIRQILTNLLSNAVKFTAIGQVELEIKFADEIFTFQVRDTGIGIPESKQQQVFELFTQADFQTASLYGGTGLGLTITRELVQLLNGTIHLSSQENRGSNFTVTLPLQFDIEEENLLPDQEEGIARRELEQLGAMRVLVAEDNLMNQALISQVLSKWGVRFDCVSNGADAVEKVHHAAYNLVLMDVLMPVMDGFEATRAIRASAVNEVKSLPVVGLSAIGSADEVQNGLMAGMNDFVSKPIDLNILRNTLLKWGHEKAGLFKYISLDFFKKNGIHHRESITELVSIYLKSTPAMLEQINRAIDSNKLDQAKLEIHSLKSNAKLFGIEGLTKILEYLENNGWLTSDNLNRARSDLNFYYQESYKEIEQLIVGL